MVFTREPPRAVEVMTAAAAAPSSSSTSPPSHRTPPALLRGKPRSRNPIPAINAWVSQRLAHCVDPAAAHDFPQAPPQPLPPTSSASAPAARRRSSPGSRDDGFERIRAKLMDHLREAADRIELPPATFAASSSGVESYRKGENAAETTAKAHVDDGGSPHAAFLAVNPLVRASVTPAPLSAAEDLPWNLRTRRSILASGARHPHPGPDASAAAAPKPATRLRSGAPERRESAMRRRRARFSVSLTKEEIDEDVYAFTGRLAARRPRRRPRAVQRQLDMLFPGLYLSEVTLDMYQVADPPPPPPS